MAFAETTDIAARLGRDLTDSEETTYESLLEGATSLIAEAAGKDDAWAEDLEPVPTVIKTLTVSVALRAKSNEDGAESETETLGAYSHTVRFSTGDIGASFGLWLTDDEVALVRRVFKSGRASGSAILGSILDDIPEWQDAPPFPLSPDPEDDTFIP